MSGVHCQWAWLGWDPWRIIAIPTELAVRAPRHPSLSLRVQVLTTDPSFIYVLISNSWWNWSICALLYCGSATPLTTQHSPPRLHQVQEKGGSGTWCSLLKTPESQLFSSCGPSHPGLFSSDVSLPLNFQGKDKNPAPGISGVVGVGVWTGTQWERSVLRQGKLSSFFLSFSLSLSFLSCCHFREGKKDLNNSMRSLQINAVNMW